MDDEPPFVHGECTDRSAQIIQIENGRAVLAVTLCGIVAALGVGFSAFAIYTAQQARMETRLNSLDIDAIKIAQKAEELHRANP